MAILAVSNRRKVRVTCWFPPMVQVTLGSSGQIVSGSFKPLKALLFWIVSGASWFQFFNDSLNGFQTSSFPFQALDMF